VLRRVNAARFRTFSSQTFCLNCLITGLTTLSALYFCPFFHALGCTFFSATSEDQGRIKVAPTPPPSWPELFWTCHIHLPCLVQRVHFCLSPCDLISCGPPFFHPRDVPVPLLWCTRASQEVGCSPLCYCACGPSASLPQKGGLRVLGKNKSTVRVYYLPKSTFLPVQ